MPRDVSKPKLLSSATRSSFSRALRAGVVGVVAAARALRHPRTAGVLRDVGEFHAAFEAAAIGIALVDARGRPLRANRALLTLLGADTDALCKRPGALLAYSADDEEQARRFDALVAGRCASYRAESRQRRQDGRMFWAQLSLSAVRAADESFRYAVVLVEDITARKEAEAALATSEGRYRALVEAFPEAIAVHDGVRFSYINPAGAQLVGAASQEAFIGTRIIDLVLPDERTLVLSRARQTQERRETTPRREMRLVRLDGRVIDVETTSTAIEFAGRPAAQVIFRDITARKALEAELEHQAYHDALTGLPNRGLFLEHLDHAVRRAPRSRGLFAVIFVDLDRFKVINDSLGHAVGDRLLAAVAERLRGHARSGDIVARLGGDEFAVLAEGLASGDEAAQLASRLTVALDTLLPLAGHTLPVAASVGVAVGTPAHDCGGALLRDADAAMYRAKRDGGARFALFDPAMHAEATARLALEADLRCAIVEGACAEFVLHYQPLVELASGRIAGYEALVRWQSPTRGLVPPGEFIRLAEGMGLIVPLGRWILREACRQARHWRAAAPGIAAPGINVNLSARQFAQPDLAAAVADALTTAGLPPGRLTLEITEGIAMADAAATLATLRALKALGVRLALDDFGTGYSSLAYIKLFPVDALKIDRTFVAGQPASAADAAIIAAVATLARALDLTVTAEGVETAAQATRLLELGCDLGQGYLFGQPLPAPTARSHVGVRRVAAGTDRG